MISSKVLALQRPQLARLLDQLEDGEVLAVTRLDHLGRDSLDVEATLRVLEERAVSVVVLQLGRTDLTLTAGRTIRRVLAPVADMERDLLVERTKLDSPPPRPIGASSAALRRPLRRNAAPFAPDTRPESRCAIRTE